MAKGMHAVFFGCKRAYYATLRVTRRTLTKMGLTAARFDLLYALHSNGRRGALQRDLRHTLGVCPSVVSRMLKALETLGYVSRERPPTDTRQRRVTLTNEGRARIQQGIRQFISWGYVQLGLESVLAPDAPPNAWEAFIAIDNAEAVLRLLRHGFGDSADLHYPWHPDD
jgi:DNA-binding MarR family transcriptional regulator